MNTTIMGYECLQIGGHLILSQKGLAEDRFTVSRVYSYARILRRNVNCRDRTTESWKASPELPQPTPKIGSNNTYNVARKWKKDMPQPRAEILSKAIEPSTQPFPAPAFI